MFCYKFFVQSKYRKSLYVIFYFKTWCILTFILLSVIYKRCFVYSDIVKIDASWKTNPRSSVLPLLSSFIELYKVENLVDLVKQMSISCDLNKEGLEGQADISNQFDTDVLDQIK